METFAGKAVVLVFTMNWFSQAAFISRTTHSNSVQMMIIDEEPREDNDFQMYDWSKINLIALGYNPDSSKDAVHVIPEAHKHQVNVIQKVDLDLGTGCTLSNDSCQAIWIRKMVDHCYTWELEGFLLNLVDFNFNSSVELNSLLEFLETVESEFWAADLDYAAVLVSSKVNSNVLAKLIESSTLVVIEFDPVDVPSPVSTSSEQAGTPLCLPQPLMPFDQTVSYLRHLTNNRINQVVIMFKWKGVDFTCKDVRDKKCLITCENDTKKEEQKYEHVLSLKEVIFFVYKFDLDQDIHYDQQSDSFYIIFNLKWSLSTKTHILYFDNYDTLASKYALIRAFNMAGIAVSSISDMEYNAHSPYGYIQLYNTQQMWKALPQIVGKL